MIPQCAKRWQLYEQMSRVLKMCEEAGFDRPWECVKFDGNAFADPSYKIALDDFPIDYEFAIAIVEGRSVFRDSEMYRADTGWRCRWDDTAKNWQDELGNWPNEAWFALTWTPPQRTIEVNGMKVKAPLPLQPQGVERISPYYAMVIHFDCAADAEAFKAALEGKAK